MAGLLSQDDVEKAQEALRILRSIPFPISSSPAHGPSTSSGETELCMYTVHAYQVYLVTCIQEHNYVYRSVGISEKCQLMKSFISMCIFV